MTLAITNNSDNLISMKELSATEVSRNFSEVLDLVEAGEEIIIKRGKKGIAKITPIDDLEERRMKILALYANREYILGDDPWDEVLAMRDEETSDDYFTESFGEK